MYICICIDSQPRRCLCLYVDTCIHMPVNVYICVGVCVLPLRLSFFPDVWCVVCSVVVSVRTLAFSCFFSSSPVHDFGLPADSFSSIPPSSCFLSWTVHTASGVLRLRACIVLPSLHCSTTSIVCSLLVSISIFYTSLGVSSSRSSK